MKRTLGIILAAALALLGGAVTAHASKSYTLSDIFMTIELPDGWTVFTRDMEPGDPAYEALGSDKATVDGLLASGDIYLDAMNESMSLEIAVSITKDMENVFDLNLLSEQAKEDALKNIEDVLAASFTVTGTSRYKTGQTTFLCADMNGDVNGQTIYVREYATIINGSNMAVSLCSYGDPISAESEGLIKGVIDSVTFTKVLEKPSATFAPPASATKAELADLKLSVEIPEGWIVYTRDLSGDDPSYAFLGTDKAAMDKMLAENNEYLYAVLPGRPAEISLAKTDDARGVFDYNLKQESELDAEAQAIIDSTLKDYPGDEITLTGTYKHAQALFLTADWRSPSENAYRKLYRTIYNGMGLDITLVTYGNPASAEQEAALKAVADSVVFAETLQKPAPRTWIWDAIGGAAALGVVAYFIFATTRRRAAKKNGEGTDEGQS